MIPAPAGQARNTRSAVEGAGLVRPCIDGGLRFISRSDRWPVEAKSAVCITRILRNTLLDAHVISAKPRVSFIGGLSDSYHTAVTINGKMMRGAHCCQSVAVRWVNGLPSENTVANYPVK